MVNFGYESNRWILWRYRGGVGLKDAFYVLFYTLTVIVCSFVFFRLFTFTFHVRGHFHLLLCVCVFLVLSIFFFFSRASIPVFSFLGDFTLTLSLVLLGSCNFFSLPVMFVKIGWFVFFFLTFVVEIRESWNQFVIRRFAKLLVSTRVVPQF